MGYLLLQVVACSYYGAAEARHQLHQEVVGHLLEFVVAAIAAVGALTVFCFGRGWGVSEANY